MTPEAPWQTTKAAELPDTFAPDGAEIRLLAQTPGASSVHARLQPGQVAAAIQHRTVDEIWYVLAGRGEIWRSDEQGASQVDELLPGVSLSIPVGTRFQFRCLGDQPLDVVIVTVPPWPGAEEAVFVEGHFRAVE
jgi:mannose-6-phosphate isomerase-like protein (cupin superfamily)